MTKISVILVISSGLLFIGAKMGDYPSKVLEMTPLNVISPVALTHSGKDLFLIDKETLKIYKVNVQNGKTTEFVSTPGTNPSSMTSDGKFLFVLDNDERSIFRIDTSNRQTVSRLEIDVDSPLAIAYGDGFLFINDMSKKTINKISIEDGTTISTIPMPTSGKGRATDEFGMCYRNGYLFITDRSTDTIYQVATSTGDVINIYKVEELPFMTGITFVNDELYVTDLERRVLAKINYRSDKRPHRKFQKTEEVVYTERYINYGPDTIDEINIAIAIPQNLPNQDIISIEFTPKNFEKKTDRWGQEFAYFTFRNVKPNQEIRAEMKVKANLYEIRYFIEPDNVGPISLIPEDIREKYTKDDIKYSISDPFIKNAVKEAIGEEKNPYWIARKIYRYVQEKMQYELSGGWNIAPTVLKRGSGSCSEYSFVYIAMLRAAGIPTRFAGSVVIRGDDASYDDVFHRWVEVYLPNYGWVPVDPSGGDEPEPEKQAEFFGGLKNRFLITTIGAGSSEYLGWEYNSSSSYKCTGRCKIMRYKGGRWEPVGKKYEKEKASIFTPYEASSRGCY